MPQSKFGGVPLDDQPAVSKFGGVPVDNTQTETPKGSAAPPPLITGPPAPGQVQASLDPATGKPTPTKEVGQYPEAGSDRFVRGLSQGVQLTPNGVPAVSGMLDQMGQYEHSGNLDDLPVIGRSIAAGRKLLTGQFDPHRDSAADVIPILGPWATDATRGIMRGDPEGYGSALSMLIPAVRNSGIEVPRVGVPDTARFGEAVRAAAPGVAKGAATMAGTAAATHMMPVPYELRILAGLPTYGAGASMLRNGLKAGLDAFRGPSVPEPVPFVPYRPPSGMLIRRSPGAYDPLSDLPRGSGGSVWSGDGPPPPPAPAAPYRSNVVQLSRSPGAYDPLAESGGSKGGSVWKGSGPRPPPAPASPTVDSVTGRPLWTPPKPAVKLRSGGTYDPSVDLPRGRSIPQGGSVIQAGKEAALGPVEVVQPKPAPALAPTNPAQPGSPNPGVTQQYQPSRTNARFDPETGRRLWPGQR